METRFANLSGGAMSQSNTVFRASFLFSLLSLSVSLPPPYVYLSVSLSYTHTHTQPHTLCTC